VVKASYPFLRKLDAKIHLFGAVMEGYAKMAFLMGEYPEVAVFRRFGALNAQNLLYLQAELKDLETSLRNYALEDQNSGHPERIFYSKDWFTLKNSCDATYEGADGNQWSTILSIRAKLKEYSIYTTGVYRIRLISR
jgi:hypothetical protein